jgi:hypothetical protein
MKARLGQKQGVTMSDTKPEPEYRFIEIKSVRGMEKRTIAKWENDGWEFLSQESATLQSVLKFRKPKGKLDQKTIALIGLAGITLVIVAIAGITTGFKDSPSSEKVAAQPTESSTPSETESSSPSPEATVAPVPEETEEEPSITFEQENAREKAMQYLDFSAFSRTGLIKQLVYDKFSNSDATFAVDSLNINWKQQAALKAQEYLNFQSFSRAGLIDQLKFEGFSDDQARYGVEQVGL